MKSRVAVLLLPILVALQGCDYNSTSGGEPSETAAFAEVLEDVLASIEQPTGVGFDRVPGDDGLSYSATASGSIGDVALLALM